MKREFILQEKIYVSNNIKFYYIESGSGDPLLLLHGVCGNTKSFEKIIPSLSTQYNVFSLDLRGHGRSDRTPNGYTLSNFTKDVVCFINDIIKKPVHIYGHSLGGILAVMLNEFIPNKIRSIVIGDSPILFSYLKQNEVFWDLWSKITQPCLGSQLSVVQLATQLSKIELTINNTVMKLGEVLPNEILFFYIEIYKATDPELNICYTDLDAVIENYDVNNYKKIKCPVHIIQADQIYSNLLTDAQLLEIKEKYIPQASHITLSGIGHDLQITNSEEILEILLNYFNSR